MLKINHYLTEPPNNNLGDYNLLGNLLQYVRWTDHKTDKPFLP